MKRSWIKRKYKPDLISIETTLELKERSQDYCECMFDESHRCNFYGVLHRHHIIPRSKCGSNLKENLIMLCERCHFLVHNSIVSLHPWIGKYRGRYVKK